MPNRGNLSLILNSSRRLNPILKLADLVLAPIGLIKFIHPFIHIPDKPNIAIPFINRDIPMRPIILPVALKPLPPILMVPNACPIFPAALHAAAVHQIPITPIKPTFQPLKEPPHKSTFKFQILITVVHFPISILKTLIINLNNIKKNLNKNKPAQHIQCYRQNSTKWFLLILLGFCI